MLDGVKKFHFIGLGGIGMSALARLLIQRGHKVSGSDIVLNENLKIMKDEGAEIFVGHAAENVCGADVVVMSSAIGADNPELHAAMEKGTVIVHRSKLLSELSDGKVGIAVAGMHGKTTTTNLLYHVFKNAGLSPSLVLGGISRNLGSNSVLGSDNYFIYEADESDGTLVNYYPTYSIITNIEEEHIGYYSGVDQIMDVFRAFIKNHSSVEKIYCSIDCENASKLAAEFAGCKTYSVNNPGASVYAANLRLDGPRPAFDAVYNGRHLGEVSLNLAGVHNVSNSLPVIGIAIEAGIPFELVRGGLREFKGTKRRMDIVGNVGGIKVVDDYAHHPTEIKATLAALRKNVRGRLIAVFQPHRYTRLKYLIDRFAGAFGDADIVILTDVYGAGEQSIEEANSRILYKKMLESGVCAEYLEGKVGITQRLLDHVREDDTFIFMGAGDVTKTSREFVKLLKHGAGEKEHAHHDELCGQKGSNVKASPQ